MVDALVALSLVVGAIAIWKWRVIASAFQAYRGGIPAADFYLQIYPMAQRAAEWMREGRLPIWNPYQFGGHPFLATGIYGVLYPLNFLYLLLPIEVAMEATMVAHLAAAGLFMYAFARAIRLSRIAAVTAGVAFMWSGFVVGETFWFPPAVCAAPWLPLGLLAVERMVRSPRLVWSAVLAVAVALSFLAGWPQTWVYSMYVIALYGGVRMLGLLRGDDPHVIRVAALLTLGVMLGVALTAAQLLPGLELQANGPRRVGGLSLVQARALAPPAPSWFLDQVSNSLPDGLHLGYMGIATMFPVLLSLFALAERRYVLLFWVIGLFSAGVTLGPDEPFFPYYRMLPGMAWFRAPQRILYLYAFSAALLAGIGMDVLARSRDGLSSRRRWSMLAVVAVPVLVFLLGESLSALNLTYLVVGLALTAVAVSVRAPRIGQAAVVALVALVAWDLYHAESNTIEHPYHDPTVFYHENELFDFIKAHQELYRTYIDTPYDTPHMMGKHGTLLGIYSITDYEPLSLRRYEQFYRLLEDPTKHTPVHVTFTGRMRANLKGPELSRLDLLSVRYLITLRRQYRYGAPWLSKGKWRSLTWVARASPYLLVENTRVLPRSYVAHAVTPVGSEEDALAAVAARTFDPWTTVVVEGAPSEPAPAPTEPKPITPGKIVRYEPTEVVIETDATSPGHLVLTDTFYPGWFATVDGKATAIQQANYLFRSVPVEAGNHTVVFRYAPRSFRLGATISVIALLCLAGIVVREVAHGRRLRASRALRLSAAATG